MKKSPGKLAKVSEDMVAETGFTVVNGREWILSIMERVNLIARDEDLDGVIQEMLGLMMEINQAESALFFQIDPTTDELVITHVKGASAGTNLVGLRINRERGLPGLTICDTQLLVVGDLTYESDWLHSLDPRSTSRNRNVINLPVNGSRQALGVIQIFNFQRAELDMLKVL